MLGCLQSVLTGSGRVAHVAFFSFRRARRGAGRSIIRFRECGLSHFYDVRWEPGYRYRVDAVFRWMPGLRLSGFRVGGPWTQVDLGGFRVGATLEVWCYQLPVVCCLRGIHDTITTSEFAWTGYGLVTDPHSFVVSFDGHGFTRGFLTASKEVANGIWLLATATLLLTISPFLDLLPGTSCKLWWRLCRLRQ